MAQRNWLVRAIVTACLVVTSLGAPALLTAQDNTPLVGFVVDTDLRTASLTDLGVAGLNRFAEVFRAYGAQVTPIDLSRPIPDNIDLVVLVRPIRQLTLPQAVRLWLHLQAGKNLLLAVDPENYFIGNANIATQLARTGLVTLLNLDYGIHIRDTFLVEPWFTTASITRLEGSYSRTFPDVVAHPVVASLRAFDVPVYVWGARTMSVEAIGIDSQAVPLLYNANGYAETSPRVFRVIRGNRFQNAADALEVNIGTDLLGHVNVAALAENSRLGSRIAVLGDSEMLLNAYGFLGSAQARQYPGNVVFAQNLAGWLLEIPVGQWLPLPPGFTWVTLDGSANEWPESASIVEDTVDPGVSGAFDIKAVRAFHDDIYTYIYVETWERPNANAHLTLSLADGARVTIDEGGVTPPHTASSEEGSTGGRAAIRAGIEIRIPRRWTESGVIDVCLRGIATDDLGIADCLAQPVPIAQFNSRAPFDVGLSSGLLVTVSNNGDINVRSGPSTATSVITMVPNGTVFAAVARSADASWVQVQNSGLSGWVSAPLVVANGEIQSLPVADAP